MLSFVYFNSKALDKLSVDDWQQLEALGFPCGNLFYNYCTGFTHAPLMAEPDYFFDPDKEDDVM
eukprot:12685158-Prorocentrum_lima.AAC.1